VGMVLYSEDFLLHDPDPYDHPESPRRLRLALEGVGRAGWPVREPCRGDYRVFEEVHDPGYVRLVESLASRGGVEWLDPDTYVVPGTLAAASRLACAVEEAVEAVRGGSSVFVLGRPPGHHAGVSGPALGAPTLGFCIFNSAALAARRLARAGRVAVLDFDVHHGNGTQEILWSDEILHVDLHQDPATIYPGTGFPEQTGGVPGTKINIILPPGAGDDIGFDAANRAWEFIVEWDPDYLVVSAGFDAMQGDNMMASTRLTQAFYGLLGSLASQLPTLIVLEGGYGRGLVEGLAAFLRGFGGGEWRPGTASGEREWEWYRRRLGELYRALGRA